MHNLVLILDFGSQYTQLIARKIREAGVYCEIHAFNIDSKRICEMRADALILSGSPYSIDQANAPKPDADIWNLPIPILGICYGMQLVANHLGASIEPAAKREYGKAHLKALVQDPLFEGVLDDSQVWMSHADKIEELSPYLEALASTENSDYAAIKHKTKPIYALQFHPEVHHSLCGIQILSNFLFNITGLKPSWNARSFVNDAITNIRTLVKNDRVILGLSGGVDSSVTAALIHKAIGDRLIPIFVDTGLMRYQEAGRVKEMFRVYPDLNIEFVDAADLFITKLSGIVDPEQKRKIIGATFIDVFEQEATKYPDAKWLAQGTLYPDVIESVSFIGPSVTIKSHHNVGGLPQKMKLGLVEPLRELFKDEVRQVGAELNLPSELVQRHPFPGPGLAVRILGAVNHHNIQLLQIADEIFIEELIKWNLYNCTWQAFAVLLPIQSVGVMGDERTYEQVCALRAVNSVDGMTAEVSKLPFDFLTHVSNRICNEVKGISRVVYDISSKPPSTIEWE
ncbi:MAG: glutamine-hydrolyzing GMP synthase [Candidatus Cloacimonetes bacterium]|nr:glutamine-hydrolyzing GMP synthase [Candidatus Cloacimonadota bacterium]MDD4687530.1 glutamine-hydrolyzing GMP synthase [Candidatus Cloacimonadota bacterium]